MKIQLCDNENCVVLRTKSGLAVLPTNPVQPFQPFYCSNTGEFRRYMSKDESAALPFSMVTLHTPCEVELPEKWKFLWSWKVSDYTAWKPETCSNGGDYAFHETHNIFGRMNTGKLELLDVVRYTTSAEFSYDEANGSFQNDGMANAVFIDCEGDFTLYTQTGSYDEWGYPQDGEYSLNQFGQPIGIYTAMEAISYEIWPVEDTDLVEEVAVASADERKTRFQVLKDTFNWEPPKRR